MTDTTAPDMTRDALLDEVARLWAQGRADQADRTPAEAAKAAGATTEKRVTEWVKTHAMPVVDDAEPAT